MKPHSLRKFLWLLNLGLVAAVVGVAAYFMIEVRPAVAKVVDRGKKQPAALVAMRKDYENMRVTGLKWTPKAPVDEKELSESILRPDYSKRKPVHWIFSGPMPPPITEEGPVVAAKPPAPEGMEALGKISMILADPPAKSILFTFSGGKRSLAFGIGDFVRQTSQDAGRFKITDIREVRPRVWEIHYDVFGDDPKKAERQGKFVSDGSIDEDYPDFLRPEGAAGPALAKPEEAEAATGIGLVEAGDGTSEGDGEAAATDAKTDVIDAANTPVEKLTLQDLKPIVHRDKRNSRRRAIEFDTNTYRYFRGKKAKVIAETVKTQVHKDPQTGRVLGLRITGFEKDAPADVFDVRRGDILVSINGQKVSSRSEAVRIGEKLDPDKLVTVIIDRNGRQLTYRVDPRDPRTKRNVRYFENLR